MKLFRKKQQRQANFRIFKQNFRDVCLITAKCVLSLLMCHHSTGTSPCYTVRRTMSTRRPQFTIFFCFNFFFVNGFRSNKHFWRSDNVHYLVADLSPYRAYVESITYIRHKFSGLLNHNMAHYLMNFRKFSQNINLVVIHLLCDSWRMRRCRGPASPV